MWADERLDGQLDALLLEWSQDCTVDQMTRNLWERGIEVSRESVRKWAARAKANAA